MPNTYSSLHYHAIFSTKRREPLRRDLLTPTHEYLAGCIRTAGAAPVRVGGVEDHVHALFRLKPVHVLADVLRDIKRASSDWLRETVPSFHWQDGYAAFTVSRSHLDRVCRYIDDQEQHHTKRTFADELRALLLANGIPFDERYLL
jgi:putative transposase